MGVHSGEVGDGGGGEDAGEKGWAEEGGALPSAECKQRQTKESIRDSSQE